ncbi:MAG: NUDIX domain-containing protein [Actinobacteria bacterium]|nr:NUDIX domain-containing protein [Actinomycetota bacterium]
MTVGLGADAVIVRDSAVLLTHRMDADLWVFPGGAVEPGESPWDAAIRETSEEAGLVATVVRLLGVAWQPEVNEIIFDFLCSAVGTPRPCMAETDAVEWFALDQLPDHLYSPHRARLESYIEGGWPDASTLTTQHRPPRPAR